MDTLVHGERLAYAKAGTQRIPGDVLETAGAAGS